MSLKKQLSAGHTFCVRPQKVNRLKVITRPNNYHMSLKTTPDWLCWTQWESPYPHINFQ